MAAIAAVAILLLTRTVDGAERDPRLVRVADLDAAVEVLDAVAAELAAQANGGGLGGLPDPATDDDFYPRDPDKEALGQLLFFDKILSGNLNISCATCHHPLAGTGDGLSLSVGEGGRGLGVTRDTGTGADAIPERVPRNAPHVFNLGAIEFETMFHDGRVAVNPAHPSGFDSPAGLDLPPGLENVLAAQAMFPVTSGTEMAGQPGENPIGTAAGLGNLSGPGGVWEQLADRLRANGEYAAMFVQAFDLDGPADITFVHAANAIAAWEAAAFRADNSPFDRFLRGDRDALSRSERRGLQIFLANCTECHDGTFQTNHEFHAIAIPQIGPGKGDNQPGYNDDHDDFGRERVTGDPDDLFRFRVPTLRNVAVTGPWGHDGAYNTLEAVVRHHLDPVASCYNYDTTQAKLPSRPDLDAQDFVVQNDVARMTGIVAACELAGFPLDDEQVRLLLDFLHALTDPDSVDMRDDVPEKVPSGLPVFE
jgi:cytochrome c peroxidase